MTKNETIKMQMKMTELECVLTAPEMDAVRLWLEYKKEKRQPYKPIGFCFLAKKLIQMHDRYGNKAIIEAIEHSMECSYQGIYLPKSKATHIVREGDDMSEVNEKLNSLDLEDL